MSDDATVRLRPAAPPRAQPDPGGVVLRILGWFLLVPGLCFLLLGLGLAADSWAFLGRAVETEAVVARLVESRGDGPLYAPVFAFKTAEGRLVEVTHDTATNPPAWTVGERLVLVYDPAAPGKAAPRTWLGLWLFATVFAGLGALLLAGGIACRIGARRILAGQAGAAQSAAA